MTVGDQLPELTENQKRVLERFAWMTATPEEVRRVLRGVFDFNLEDASRTAHSSFRVPVPGIRIGREHVENALERKREHRIAEGDLVSWATLILVNPAYELDPVDEDLLAEWLNDISYNLEPY
jgi:hypothetical protein